MLNLKTSSPLLSPEMPSLLSKLRIFLFNVHLALFFPKDDIIIVPQFHRLVSSLSKLTLELALEVVTILSPLADQTTNRILAELGEYLNVRSSA